MYENPAQFHGIYVLFKDVKLTHVYHAISLTLWQKKIINLYSLNWFRSTMIIINKKWGKNTREHRTTYQFCRLSKSTRLIWNQQHTSMNLQPKKVHSRKIINPTSKSVASFNRVPRRLVLFSGCSNEGQASISITVVTRLFTLRGWRVVVYNYLPVEVWGKFTPVQQKPYTL